MSMKPDAPVALVILPGGIKETDAVMPGMGGKKLVDWMKTSRPGIKSLHT